MARSIKDIALLLALADGTEHSGKALGALLELRADSVYRRLHALEQEGLVLSRPEETIDPAIGIARLLYTLTDAGARVLGLPVLNELEYHVLAHSTAWESRSPLCRNHFCASEGHDDWATIQALCERGMMQERKGSPLTGGDNLFIVTQLGIQALEKRGTAGKQSKRRSGAAS